MLFAFSNGIFRVDIQAAPTFAASQPVEIEMPGIMASSAQMRHFDLTPDGQHLLVILAERDSDSTRPTTTQISVVLNWFDELKAKVPVR